MLALVGFLADVWASLQHLREQPVYVMGVLHLSDNISVLSKNKHIHRGNCLWSVRHNIEGIPNKSARTHPRTHSRTITRQIPNTSNTGI